MRGLSSPPARRHQFTVHELRDAARRLLRPYSQPLPLEPDRLPLQDVTQDLKAAVSQPQQVGITSEVSHG